MNSFVVFPREVALVFVLLAATCNAFVGPRMVKQSTARYAYIFGVEDDGGSVLPPTTTTTTTSSFPPPPSTLLAMHGLARLNEARASLARVAAAFPPLGHSLSLQNIADINVLGVEPTSMELQAIVCEEDQCVTVAIPVALPNPCNGGDEMEECLLSNLDELDMQARYILERQDDQVRNYETYQAHARQTQDLLSMEGANLPHWWSKPTDAAMEQECASLQSLLNEEDFRNEIRSLAVHSLNQQQMQQAQVLQATVSAIGPAGMFLRALVYLNEGTSSVLDIPFAFPLVAADTSELRTTVIDTIEKLA